MTFNFKFGFLIITVLFFTVQACLRDYTIGYHYTSMHLSHLDNSGPKPMEVYKDSLPATSYGIRMLFETQMDFQSEAYKAEKSEIINQNPITSIVISSSDSFALNLPPGVPLNDCFLYYKGIYGQLDSIPTSKPFQPSNEFAYHDDIHAFPEYADLLLVKPPFKPGIHRFFVTLTFQDGSVFKDSLSPVKLF